MEFWNEADQEAKSVGEETSSISNVELDILRSALSLYAEAFSHAIPKERTDQAIARMGLVSQNFNTLILAVHAAYRGYYLQSIILLKNVYENWLAFWYLAKFPDDSHLWLDPNWDLSRPGSERMRNQIDHPSIEAKSQLHGFYQEFNRFAHTDPVAILDRYRVVEGKPGIWVGVEFSEGDFSACAYALSLWIGNMLDVIRDWIPSDHEWHKRHDIMSKLILAFLNQQVGLLDDNDS